MTIPVNDIQSTIRFLGDYHERVKDLFHELQELTNDAYDIEQDWLDDSTFKPAGSNDGYYESIANRLDEALLEVESVSNDINHIFQDLIELKVNDDAQLAAEQSEDILNQELGDPDPSHVNNY